MYKNLLTLIKSGRYDKDDITKKANLFLAKGKITQEEYDELIGLMNDDA